MINTSIQLLTTLHQELSALNGYLIVAPKIATYPLMTYTILNSQLGRVKSFTGQTNSFNVQFSYFSDNSLASCMSLAASAETRLDSLSAFFDMDDGNINIIGNSEQHNYYQLNDTRVIELPQ